MYIFMRKQNRLNKKQIATVIRLYSMGGSSVKLSRQFGVSSVAIRGLLKRRGIILRDMSLSRRTHTLNETCFDEINDASAYWIGFLIADGCIYRNEIILALASRDKSHLEKFRRFLNSSHPITKTNVGAYVIRFRSTPLCEKLKSYGVTSQKSLYAKTIPLLACNQHFWRGVFDGDGYLGIIEKPSYYTKNRNSFYWSKPSTDIR